MSAINILSTILLETPDKMIENLNTNLSGIPEALKITLSIIAGIVILVGVIKIITSGEDRPKRNNGIAIIGFTIVSIAIVYAWEPLILPFAKVLFTG